MNDLEQPYEGLWYYVGNVKDGSPYYNFQNYSTYYLYFDKLCGTNQYAGWVIDFDEPATDRDENLDLYSDSYNGEDCLVAGYYWNRNNNIQTIMGTHTWELTQLNSGWATLTISEYIRQGNNFKVLQQTPRFCVRHRTLASVLFTHECPPF